MKKILFFSVLFACLLSYKANAAITVTAGTGGTNICSNKAQTGPAPAFTTLTPIVITENAVNDITAGAHNLVIAAPAGWRFNTAATPTYTFTGADITAVFSGAPTAGTLTITIIAGAIANINTITITGLQVQATTTASGAGNIRATNNGGIASIVVGVTNFGALSLTTALVPSVTIAASPAGAICAGTPVLFTATPVNGGVPTYQWSIAGAPIPGATSDTFSSATLVNGNTVRVAMTATGCVNPALVNSNIITMVVNAVPAAVTVSTAGTYCDNTTLTATGGGGGTIYYQGAVYNGVSVATPSSSQLIATPGTLTYYFRAGNAGCWGPQGSAKVTINPSPGLIGISPASTASFCIGDSGTFVAAASSPTTEVLYEDFDAGLGAWTMTSISGVPSSDWQIYLPPGWSGAVPGGGTQYVEAASDATGPGITTSTILTSPSFDLTGYTSATLSFNQLFLSYAADITVAVEYSIDGGFSWIPFIDQLGTTVGSTNWVPSTPTTTVALPGAVLNQPNVQLRWNYSSVWGWYWAIDNVAVSGTPTLTYNWVGVAGATGLSCATCDTVTITPAATGANDYNVSTTVMGCTSTATLTITANALPAIYNVTGGGHYCAGGTGVDVSLDNSDATVNYQLYNGGAPVGGAVLGVSGPISFGLQTVAGTYTVMASDATSACSSNMNDSAVIVIDPLPSPITGPNQVCVGDTITLVDTTAGGTWSSSDIVIAPVDMVGAVAGGAPGVADISYTLPTTCSVTYSVTVNTLPAVAPITGITNLCVGGNTTLSTTSSGGAWSSDDGTIASIDAVTGLVNAVSAGNTIISYIITDGFGCTGSASTGDTVTAPPATAILPVGPYVTMCNGSPVNLVATNIGGAGYQWSTGGSPIAGATNHSYIATTPGIYTLDMTLATCAWTLPTRTVLAPPNGVISYNSTGNYLYTGSFTTYQWFRNGVAITGATSSILLSPTGGNYTVVVGDFTGCKDTSAVYTIMSTAVSNVSTNGVNVKVYPNPASTIVYIDAPVKVSVSVITPDGRLVIDNKEAASINISGLANGVYMILVYDENNMLLKTERFSKID